MAQGFDDTPHFDDNGRGRGTDDRLPSSTQTSLPSSTRTSLPSSTRFSGPSSSPSSDDTLSSGAASLSDNNIVMLLSNMFL